MGMETQFYIIPKLMLYIKMNRTDNVVNLVLQLFLDGKYGDPKSPPIVQEDLTPFPV